MNKNRKQVIREFLQEAGSKGGKARAAKYDKATLSKWAQKGGKPRKGPASEKGDS
jgi:general stress protein YciG